MNKPFFKIEQYFRKNILKIIGILFLIGVFFVLRDFLTVIIFIAIGALSMFHQRFTGSYFGFELATFFTVLAAMKYGALAGIVVGVLSITLGLAISGHIHHTVVVSMLGFLMIGFIASFFPLSQFFLVGFALTIIYDIVTVPIYLLLGSNPVSSVFYFATHILLNYFIFSRGEYFLKLTGVI